MGMTRGRMILATAGAALLAAGLATPSAFALPSGPGLRASAVQPTGDLPARPMTRAQARSAYRDAVCPMNAVTMSFLKAMEGPDTPWTTVQPLIRALARKQSRAARLLSHPTRPWPDAVSDLVAYPAELFLRQAGANEVLAGTTSREEYDALLESLVSNLLADTSKSVTDGQRAIAVIKKRLGFASESACPTS